MHALTEAISISIFSSMELFDWQLLFFSGNAKYRSVRGFVDRDERGALAVDGVRCQDPGGDQGHGGEELGAGSQVEREELLSNIFSSILSNFRTDF